MQKWEMMELTEKDISKTVTNNLNVLKEWKDNMNIWGNGRLELKISLDMFNRLDTTGEKIRELEDISIDSLHSEA